MSERVWQWVGPSELLTWTVERKPRGCRWCRLRALLRWPRPYRHFNCGPVRKLPGVPLASLLAAETATSMGLDPARPMDSGESSRFRAEFGAALRDMED